MAEEQKIVLKVEVDGMERNITSMQELKKARKDLQNAFLQGDEQAIKSLKKLDDAMGDLQDATKSVQGDGVEPLRNSFRLFTEGLTNFDFGKIGTAFKGLGAAMKAVPIFLLVEGITYLITNFKELSKGTGILATVLKPIGEIIGWITDGLYALTDAIGLTNTALDEMGENTVKNAESSKEALSQQNAEYDRQIKVAKAAGKSTVELEQAKQQAIIDTNVQIVKQIEAFVRAGGVLDEEKKKLLTASLEAIKNAKVEEYVIEKDAEKKINDDKKKASDERKKLLEAETQARLEELDKQFKYEQDLNKKRKEEAEKLSKDIYNNLLKTLKDSDAARAEEVDKEYLAAENKRAFSLAQNELSYSGMMANLQKERDAKLNDMSLTQEQRIAIVQEYEEKERALRQQTMDKYAETTKQGLQAAQALTDLFFSYQLKKAKGNEAEEKRIKKRAFNVNKAFGVANAVIDGVGAVQKALNNPYPLNIVLAVLSGVLAAANVAKIASTKFDDGGSSAGGGGDIQAGGGALAGASAPAINQPNNTVTQLNEDGVNEAKSQPTQKVVVVESDITEKQKTVAKIEETATI